MDENDKQREDDENNETTEAEETETTDEAGATEEETTEETEETDDKAKAEKDQEEKDPLADLPEKTRMKVDKRIGKVVAREKAKTEAAEARATAAEEKLKNATFTDPETRLPFPSEYVSADEVQTLKKLDELKAARKMLRPMRHEGYEGDGGVKYTPAQVEARLDEIEEDLEAILPKATTIRARAEQQFAADMKELRELRKQKAAGTLGGGSPAPKKDLTKKPPQAPGSTRNAGASGAGPKSGQRSLKVDENEVHDKDSFKAQLKKAMAG